MKDEPPAKRRIRLGKLWWWVVAIFLAVCGWQAWRVYQYQAAVREAREAGMAWRCDDTISLIRQDWHNALKNGDMGRAPRNLYMGEVRDPGRYREMVHRLRPTGLFALGCESVDGLKSLTKLQSLFLDSCPVLQNLDGLEALIGLQKLTLSGCPALQNVDGLKGLTGLQGLILYKCSALQSMDSLKALVGLQELTLRGCTALQNVDGLKNLTGLQKLDLHGCDKIPAAVLRELRAALPNTDITFPDGSKNPPQ